MSSLYPETTQGNTMWLPALLASSLVSLQIFIKAGVAVCCLLLQLIFPFLPCSVTWGADRGGVYLGLTFLRFLVGFGQWEAPAGTGGRKESQVGCLGWAAFSPFRPSIVKLPSPPPPPTHTPLTVALLGTLNGPCGFSASL